MNMQEANTMNIKKDLKEFENIWNVYYQLLPINEYEFDIYVKIVNNIRKNEFDFVKDKFCFIELLEIMSFTLYNYKENDNDFEVYDDEKEYSDKDLNCCYRLKKYFKPHI
jgi:hypothetical protein